MKLLLVLDLDNTLVGDDRATIQFNHWFKAQEGRVTLVYSTGRSWTSAQAVKEDRSLLEPDYWVTAVGTEIYHQNQLDPLWAANLNVGWDRKRIAALAAQFPALTPQLEPEQRPWKVSFYLDKLLNAVGQPHTLDSLASALEQADLSAQVVYSSDRDVDILPTSGNKGNALTYLRERLGFAPEQTIVGGDSGNDISLFSGPEWGILVGNALPELLFWYQRHGQPRHYLARMPYAWGILEGLEHLERLKITSISTKPFMKKA